MGNNQSEREYEEIRLKQTISLAEEQLKQAKEAAEKKKSQIIEAKKEVRENATHSVTNLYTSDGFEALVELSQYMNPVTDKIVDYEEEEHRILLLENMIKSPYFARIDFKFDDEEECEKIYIGRSSLRKNSYQEMYVYDWRSPIASIFYRFMKGEAFYDAPCGRVTGELKLKRQYEIKNGVLKYFFDTDVQIVDEFLRQLLSQNTTAKMKAIVETIQQEQDAVIRDMENDLLMVQGVAGSGKTSVALHRIAYLLYHDRQNLKSSNILILSPNGVFSDYISHILPELGEENIKEMSFDLFAYKQLRDTVSDCEDRYDEIERRIRFPQKASLAEEKQSMEFINLMERYLVELEDRLMNFRDVEYNGFVKTESEIIELFYFKFQDFPLLSRMDAVADYFIDEVETLRNRDLADDEKDLIREKFMKLYVTGDLYVIYSQFLKENGYKGLPRVSYEKRKLKYEDVYPVLYLKYRLQSQQGRSNIKHLVVDEMQDYSRLQYEILQRIFSCKMTILGDRAQTMDDKQQDVLKFLPKIFGRDIHKIIMNKSYRNTIEIASYANQLAGIEDMELFERHGAPVEEKIFADVSHAAEKIAETLKLGEEEYETAAVVLRTEKEAEHMWLLLKEILGEKGFDIKERLSYLDRNSTSFKKGLTVTTFYLAKGLEFDQVFAVFPQKDQTPLVRQARYIAATRALHELHMYEVEK